MKFSLYQMDIIPGLPQDNYDKVRRWAEKVTAEENPDTLVLPELWTTAYTLPQLAEIADENGQETKSFLQQLAVQHKVNVVGGSVAVNVNGNIYNATYVFNRSGEEVYHYDKVHLVPMLDEPDYLTGGERRAEVFELNGVKMGAIICYDLRFPELIRPLALEGAQVLFIAAEWPLARRDHWRYLQIARAIENQMFVVSCNRSGSYDGTEFAGTSMVVDPWGDVVAEGSVEQEETISVSLDMDKVHTVREQVPIFTSRVPHLYKKEEESSC